MNTDAVNIELVLKSPIEQVWRAWTDPILILKWFGSDPKGYGVKAHLDVRPGGSFEVTFRDGDQTEHTCSGRYIEVMIPDKLAFSWAWKNEPGVESFVTVSLFRDDLVTRMVFRHAQLGEGSAHNYQQGWKSTFEKLRKILGEVV